MRLRKKNNSVKAQLEKFLKDYNCSYDVKTEDSGSNVYEFEFQAGNFIAVVRKQDDGVQVFFPDIAKLPMSQLPLVRSMCNDKNNHNILFKYTYDLDEKAGDISVSLSFYNNSLDDKEFAYELKAAFHFQHEWTHDYDEAVKMSKDYNDIDLESELYKHHREMNMLRCQEMMHQIVCGSLNLLLFSCDEPLSLDNALEYVEPSISHHAQMLFMTVNTMSGQQQFKDKNAILDFDLRRALVEGTGAEARLVRDYAVLDLHYKMGEDQKPQMATIAITAEGEDKNTIFTRVTITLPMRNASRANSLSNDERGPHSKSFLLGLGRNGKKQYEEAEYMWTDALLKIKNGEQSSMSEDEILLSQVYKPDVAYNLYWGNLYFTEKRYLEAIIYLENVFNSYREEFFDLSGDEKRMFMEVAYKLGFCYNDLGRYKEAYYYLDLMANDGNIRHTMEMVNNMANNKDLRVFNYTDGVMEEVKRNFENQEEVPEHIRQFISFLRRRRGYALIDFGKLDDAEKIFTSMLDDLENAPYASQELGYIKHLRSLRERYEASLAKRAEKDQKAQKAEKGTDTEGLQ